MGLVAYGVPTVYVRAQSRVTRVVFTLTNICTCGPSSPPGPYAPAGLYHLLKFVIQTE